jgi:uncharacterized RDD family membrane protein YckC
MRIKQDKVAEYRKTFYVRSKPTERSQDNSATASSKRAKTIVFDNGQEDLLAPDIRRVGGYLLDSILIAIPLYIIMANLAYCTLMISTKGTTLGGMATHVRAADAATGSRLSLGQSFKRALGAFAVQVPYLAAGVVADHYAGFLIKIHGTSVMVTTSQRLSEQRLWSLIGLAMGVVALVCWIWIDVDAKKRTWYDIWAGTVVVSTITAPSAGTGYGLGDTNTPAGWYPDGVGLRYWDGAQWTEHTQPLPRDA